MKKTDAALRRRRPGPDFLCVGMQKAGTRWLYDTLSQMDGFSMPPIKEFHHFDSVLLEDGPSLGRQRRRFRNRTAKSRRELPTWVWLRFAMAARGYIGNGRTDEAYCRLFQPFSHGVTGDITPGYSRLGPDMVRRVHALLPHAKVVAIIRHPSERAWSAFKMDLRRQLRPKKNGLSREQVEAAMLRSAAPDRLRAFLNGAGAQSRSHPSQLLANWGIFGDNLGCFDFRKIVLEPDRAAGEIASFLMGRRVEPRPGIAAPNAKASKASVPMTDEMRSILFEHFRDEIEECKRIIPEIAENWRTG